MQRYRDWLAGLQQEDLRDYLAAIGMAVYGQPQGADVTHYDLLSTDHYRQLGRLDGVVLSKMPDKLVRFVIVLQTLELGTRLTPVDYTYLLSNFNLYQIIANYKHGDVLPAVPGVRLNPNWKKSMVVMPPVLIGAISFLVYQIMRPRDHDLNFTLSAFIGVVIILLCVAIFVYFHLRAKKKQSFIKYL